MYEKIDDLDCFVNVKMNDDGVLKSWEGKGCALGYRDFFYKEGKCEITNLGKIIITKVYTENVILEYGFEFQIVVFEFVGNGRCYLF